MQRLQLLVAKYVETSVFHGLNRFVLMDETKK